MLDPVGTAPGLVVPPADDGGGPTVVVLPGPPGELQPMWAAATATEAFRAAVPDTVEYRWQIMRLFGIPESEIVATLDALRAEGVALDRLEVTTCLRRGEIEIATRYEPDADPVYAAFERGVAARHADTLYSTDGSTIDEQVAAALAGHTIATAESCTGGGLAARLTDRAGSSDYVLGGLVVYANAAKTALAGGPRRSSSASGRSRSRSPTPWPTGRARGSGPRSGGDHRGRRTRRRNAGEARGDRVLLGGRADGTPDPAGPAPGRPRRRPRPLEHRGAAHGPPAARRRARRVSDRVRLFVAADLPPAVRAVCAAWRDEVVGPRPALRAIPDGIST